jgi:nanoRNase/pAp phosphatase (c-di-AMP/oligoRNAs hydrolase)
MYRIFIEKLGYDSSKEDNELIMYGILGDTNRFLFKNNEHRATFKVVSDLIDSGVSIEEVQQKLNEMSVLEMKVFTEFLRNFNQKNDYNYFYLTDECTKKLVQEGVTSANLSFASHHILLNYLRNVTPNNWGFSIYPDIQRGEGEYRGSFRSISGVIDTSVYSRLLGGGGHKLASGFDIEANSLEDALETVHNTIKKHRQEAVDSINE